jgi:hypothetical protein
MFKVILQVSQLPILKIKHDIASNEIFCFGYPFSKSFFNVFLIDHVASSLVKAFSGIFPINKAYSCIFPQYS